MIATCNLCNELTVPWDIPGQALMEAHLREKHPHVSYYRMPRSERPIDAAVASEDVWLNPVTGHGGDCGCISCHMNQTQ